MGGLWVDYNLMSTIPGLFVLGEANFSDHGANRLGASALMQGLADGYFIIPYTIGHYLAAHHAGQGGRRATPPSSRSRPRWRARVRKLLAIKGKRTVDSFHRELGKIMWDHCGMARNEAGPRGRRSQKIPALREEFWSDVNVLGANEELNQSLEKAGRVADFLELGELMCLDALERARVLRRPLPRGVPDAGGRGPARRRAASPRRGLGVHGARASADPPQGAA